MARRCWYVRPGKMNFKKAINSTGGCFRISMDYSAVDVSWWKELEAIAKKYGYTLDSESLEIIQEYVQKYKKYENHFWEYGKKIITFEQFSRMLSKRRNTAKRSKRLCGR